VRGGSTWGPGDREGRPAFSGRICPCNPGFIADFGSRGAKVEKILDGGHEEFDRIIME
jgi:hypothetical protein